IQAGGDPAKFGAAYPALAGGSYTSMWWIFPGNDKIIAACGVHGQTIYVDPSSQMVLVRFASFPQAGNAAIDPTSLPAFRAVAAYLRKR
ncbi:MAG TPA: 6-aminohexanoate hydrolase, partial [Allosphingosinicella sp.]